MVIPTTTPTCAKMIDEKRVSGTRTQLGVLCRHTGHCIGKTGTLQRRKTKIYFIDDRLGNNNNIIMVPTFSCIFSPLFLRCNLVFSSEFLKLLNEHSRKSMNGAIHLKFE